MYRAISAVHSISIHSVDSSDIVPPPAVLTLKSSRVLAYTSNWERREVSDICDFVYGGEMWN